MASLKIALKVDSENAAVGDLYIEHGKVRMTATLGEEVAQLLFLRFRMFQGEWFLDRTAGIPWLQRILGQKGSQDLAATIMRRVITTCPGVKSLDTFEIKNPAPRSYTTTFTATLMDGTVLRSSDFSPFVIQTP